MNLRMLSKVNTGNAIDLSRCPRTQEGHYILDDFFEDTDYCDLNAWRWIWSIGISYKTGQILASINTCFYQNPEFECLWLR